MSRSRTHVGRGPTEPDAIKSTQYVAISKMRNMYSILVNLCCCCFAPSILILMRIRIEYLYGNCEKKQKNILSNLDPHISLASIHKCSPSCLDTGSIFPSYHSSYTTLYLFKCSDGVRRRQHGHCRKLLSPCAITLRH